MSPPVALNVTVPVTEMQPPVASNVTVHVTKWQPAVAFNTTSGGNIARFKVCSAIDEGMVHFAPRAYRTKQ
jgi:hypothetical protein